jgi:hypothetical protein
MARFDVVVSLSPVRSRIFLLPFVFLARGLFASAQTEDVTDATLSRQTNLCSSQSRNSFPAVTDFRFQSRPPTA